MNTKVDIALLEDDDGVYDVSFGDDGDFTPCYGFDTSITMSMFTEARADKGDVYKDEQRRGWIGNETPDIPGLEIGSKLWLEFQARKTTRTKNAIVDHIKNAYAWMVPNYLNAIDVTGKLEAEGISVTIIPTYKTGKVDKILYKLWQHTGI